MSRFSKADWLALGLQRLTDAGLDGLTVEAMCGAADRTKGSFYHHFDDHAAFLKALAEAWKARQTDAVIAAVEAGGATARGSRLHDLAATLDHRLDGAIRRAATQRPAFAAAQAQVDAERIGYIARILRQEHGMDEAQAERMAETEYALFVGCQSLWPDRPPLSVLDGWAEAESRQR